MYDYRAKALELADQLTAWRRDFHQHPELGFEETRTAGIVAEYLHSLGVETTAGVGGTGVVGLIEGSSEGPTVLLRFDMDALPIEEATGLPYSSQTPGVMHACGHDGHTAIGLGVATLLAESTTQWPGQVKLLFQPAEEGMGGALATIRDGVLEHPQPDSSFGLHLWNQFSSGRIIVQTGPLMAAADRFVIEIVGSGGHGAQPHTTIDAIMVGAQAVNALQSIVSRNIPPQETVVLTVGSFHAGDAFNVIADRVKMSGTLRTFDPIVREKLIQRMDEILAGITAAHGASYNFTIDANHVPAVINDPVSTRAAASAASALFGEAQVDHCKPLMVAEDMSEIINRSGGCYMLLGAKPPEGRWGPHHSPTFNIDEAMLPEAVALMVATAVTYLNQEKLS
ncbi:MAG: amidohydrolase [Chloroflexi bacterium]|nr:amidohydrolase [Chloroflexota bacterium]